MYPKGHAGPDNQRPDKWSCNVFENKMLNRKFISKRKEVRGILRKLHNAKRCGLYCPPRINALIQLRRMRWNLVGLQGGKIWLGKCSVDGRVILRWISRELLDSAGWVWYLLMGRFWLYSEPAFSVIRWKFLDRLSDCKLVKKELVFIHFFYDNVMWKGHWKF
jgi:hypothetical protein